MQPDEKVLLQKTFELAADNNLMLRSMRNRARWGSAFKAGYWILIIILSVGGYFAIQPYLNSLNDAYGSLKTTTGQLQNLGDTVKNIGTGL